MLMTPQHYPLYATDRTGRSFLVIGWDGDPVLVPIDRVGGPTLSRADLIYSATDPRPAPDPAPVSPSEAQTETIPRREPWHG